MLDPNIIAENMADMVVPKLDSSKLVAAIHEVYFNLTTAVQEAYTMRNHWLDKLPVPGDWDGIDRTSSPQRMADMAVLQVSDWCEPLKDALDEARLGPDDLKPVDMFKLPGLARWLPKDACIWSTDRRSGTERLWEACNSVAASGGGMISVISVTRMPFSDAYHVLVKLVHGSRLAAVQFTGYKVFGLSKVELEALARHEMLKALGLPPVGLDEWEQEIVNDCAKRANRSGSGACTGGCCGGPCECNGKCPKCGSPAYVGFSSTECTLSTCENYKENK